MFLGHLRVPFPSSVQVVESTGEVKNIIPVYLLQRPLKALPTPVSGGFCPPVGLGVRFKATLTMISPYQLFSASAFTRLTNS